MNDIILISEDYIKQHSDLMANVENKMLVTPIFVSQNIDYKTLIGKDLFNRVITEFTTYKTYVDGGGTDAIGTIVSSAIIDLVDNSRQFLLYRVLYNGNYTQATKKTNKGIVEQSSNFSENVDMKMLASIKTENGNLSNSLGTTIIEFIEENITDYPEYSTDCDNTSTNYTQGLYTTLDWD
jgi:hypothetical protein